MTDQRTVRDSECCRLKIESPLWWRDFQVRKRSVPEEIVAAAGAARSVIEQENAEAKIETLRIRASNGSLAPRGNDGEEPFVKPIRQDPDVWELRADLSVFGAGLFRLYFTEAYVDTGHFVALRGHVKWVDGDPQAVGERQDQEIDVALNRHSEVDQDLTETTVIADINY